MLRRFSSLKRLLVHSFFSNQSHSSTLKSTRRVPLLTRCLLLIAIFFSPSVFAVSVTASSSTVKLGSQITISWSGTAMGCSLTSNPSGYSGGGSGGTGTKTFTASKLGQVTFKVTCYGNRGVIGQGWTSVNVISSNAAPSVTVSVPSAGHVGKSVTLTASASDSDGSIARVEFYVNNAKVSTDTSAPYRYSYAITSTGSKTIYARAVDNKGASKNSTAKTLVASYAPFTLSIDETTSTDGRFRLTWNNVPYGGGYKLWQKKGSGSWVNTGASGSPANAVVTSDGLYTYRVRYKSCPPRAACIYGVISNEVSVNVNLPNIKPSVSLVIPSVGNVGENVNFTASASDSDGSINKVEFYVNGNKECTETLPPYKCEYHLSSSGNKTVYAKAVDNDGAETNSSSKNLKGNAYPSVSVSVPSRIIVGQRIILRASASDSDGSISKVEFYVNGRVIETVTTSPYSAPYTVRSSGNVYARAYDNDDAAKNSLSKPFNPITSVSEAEAFAYSLTDTNGLPSLSSISKLDANGYLAGVSTDGGLTVVNGSASYSIGIQAPPASGGLAPGIALSYSSDAVDGIAGFGWNISGLPTIFRCKAGYANEGDNAQDKNPNYTKSDRLCLSGSKLELVGGDGSESDTEYWATGAEYRTESESFTKIIASGTSGTGHNSFTVYDKSGLIHEYGATMDSQHIAPGTSDGTVKVWALNKAQDRYSNYFTAHYIQDTVNNQFYVSHVLYNLASDQPTSAIVFAYEDRDEAGVPDLSNGFDMSAVPSINWGYDNGEIYYQKKLLKRINTYVNVINASFPSIGENVFEYNIEHIRSEITGHYLVDEVSKCGFGSAGIKECAAPITFDWSISKSEEADKLGFEATEYEILDCSTEQPLIMGKSLNYNHFEDVDDDGYNDIVSQYTVIAWGTATGCFDKTHWEPLIEYKGPFASNPPFIQFFATKQGRRALHIGEDKKVYIVNFVKGGDVEKIPFTGLGAPNSIYPSFIAGDFNNDGLTDFYTHALMLQDDSDILGFTAATDIAWTIDKLTEPCLRDFNNDGLIDLSVALHKTNGDQGNETVGFENTGDGFSDIEAFRFDVTSGATSFITGGTCGSLSSSTPGVIRSYIDVNGDGLEDLVFSKGTKTSINWGYYYKDPKWMVRYATGSNIAPFYSDEVATGIAAVNHSEVPLGGVIQHYYGYDYNQDGVKDLILLKKTAAPQIRPESRNWILYLSTFKNGQMVFVETAIDPTNNLAKNLARISYNVPGYSLFIGDVNNDGVMDLRGDDPSGAINGTSVYLGKTSRASQLKSVTNSFGVTTQLEFSALNGDDSNGRAFYLPSEEPMLYPHTQGSRYRQVVKKLSTENNQGGFNDTYYYYRGAKYHYAGGGSRGFEQIDVVNTAQGIETAQIFNQEFPFIGTVKSVVSKATSGELISATDFHYKVHDINSRYVYTDYQITKDYRLTTTDINNPFLVVRTDNIFDANGCLDKQIISTGSSENNGDLSGIVRTVTEDNDFNSSTGDWLLCYLTDTTISSQSGSESDSITSSFEARTGTFDTAKTTRYAGTQQQVITIKEYNARGQVTKTRVQAKNINNAPLPERTVKILSFQDGLYPSIVRNAKGHTVSSTYGLRFGNTLTSTNPHGQTMTSQVDSFGRVVTGTDTVGSVASSYFMDCSMAITISCPVDAILATASLVTNPADSGAYGSPLSIQYMDKFGQAIHAETFAFNGKSTKITSEYDALGRTTRTSNPYVTVPEYWSETSNYDVLNRAGEVSMPDGGSARFRYAIDGAFYKTTKTMNIVGGNSNGSRIHLSYESRLGEVDHIVDPLNIPIHYTYDLWGNLETTMVDNDADTTITLDYNNANLRTYIDDPDAGIIDFEYNGFGELEKQTWQKGTSAAKSMSIFYDVLGRKVRRIDDPVSGSNVSYSWEWDTRKVGLLTSKTGNGITENYYYNSLVQLERTSTSITGLGSRDFGFSYDTFGRPETLTYPSGFAVTTQYHDAGMVVQTQDTTDSNNAKTIWVLGNVQNSRGSFIYSAFGNGLVRKTMNHNDSGLLNKIVTGKLIGNTLSTLVGNIQNLEYQFDSVGNLASRKSMQTNNSGTVLSTYEEGYIYDELNRVRYLTASVGLNVTNNEEYRYDNHGNLTYKSPIGTLNYAANGAGIHAVTSADGQNYQYDAYGNVVEKGSTTLEYDVFNKMTEVDGDQFFYGPDHARFKQINGNKTTYYFGGGAYEEIVEGSKIQQKTYIGDYLVHTKTDNKIESRYLHRDHLGSVEAISNELGEFVTRMSFDAWGQRRKSDWDTGIPPIADLLALPTTRGFTGHEMLDTSGLIHMNGRVYDPTIGRFLSTDILIQAPNNSQSYNRYSYVWNNPLSMVDPSGYACGGIPLEYGILNGNRVSSEISHNMWATRHIRQEIAKIRMERAREESASRAANKAIKAAIEANRSVTKQPGTLKDPNLAKVSDTGQSSGKSEIKKIGGSTSQASIGASAQTGSPSANQSTASSSSSTAIPSLPAPCTGECVADGIDLSNMPSQQSTAAEKAQLAKFRVAPKPPKTRGVASMQALAIIFGNDVNNVRLDKDGRAKLLGALATTDVNQIWFSPTASNCSGCTYSSFFGEDGRNVDFTVLEEYFHVTRQWNTGNMTKASYLWEATWNGYDNNKYEIEAKGFARDNLTRYRQLIRQQQ